ncbi:alpha-xenorhabdolysin family binary toxin subunit A [Pseudomonas sp. 21LCFQ010]|uniref:alpha-xenorhabdolysin family binary toxin subunit A n=1 Tax=Pseudomonas sp. 21LCFQ010 TaxID=2957506 RepID=UPI0020972E0A|nr:alpha-xenorhabdolysin family binary toxin subunit A [Pseudomonas sp. 21LCFQ010]MCO8162199.1 alpha-xenorhabdolysin family binary toxin subunit A [Pseudomonas sp. 21LCFQ010]
MNIALQPLEGRDISVLFVDYLITAAEDEHYGGRPPALYVTAEDIFNIKRYERHSLDLPITLKDLEDRLRLRDSAVSGLTSTDLLQTYQAINQHARSWSGIENSMTTVGLDIESFAESFTLQGSRIIQAVDRMEIIDQFDLTVADLTLDIVKNTPGNPLSEQDQRIVIRLAEWLENIATTIKEHEQSAKRLANDIESFANALSTVLIPDVKHKTVLARNAGLDKKTRELEDDIQRLTGYIDELTAGIKNTRNNRWWGLFGGLVGFLIADDITGKQAQELRARQKDHIDRKAIKVDELRRLNSLSSAVAELELNLQNMEYRMADAQASAKNLQNLWAALAYEITESAEQLKKVNNSQELFDFAYYFSSVVKPWANVKNIVAPMLQTYREALEQFNRH